MVAQCISGMVNSFRKNPTLLLGVALGSKTDHQPGVQDLLAKDQGEQWHEDDQLCLILPLLEWLQA